MHDTPPAVQNSACRNCSAALTGPYCAQCGQHAHESARSLHTLMHDAWHLLTHLDGRLWGTLALLMLKPGRLTGEYFADRRTRYLPPFRLYFVISIAFFGLASLTSAVSVTTADRAQLPQELREQLQQSDAPAALITTIDEVTSRPMTPELVAKVCGRMAFGLPRLDLRLQAVCRHQLADQGKSMLHAFGSLFPKMMFVFLPLMAVFMLPLYRSPPRYYVEHLVFFLHLQSALFLAMILEMLLAAAAEALPRLNPLASSAGMILIWYAVWYVYAGMHEYYERSWTRTLGKFSMVVLAYLCCFALFLGATALLSVLLT